MRDPLAELIAESFEDIPPAKWIVPDDSVRRRLLAAQFEILVDHAQKYGVVHVGGEGDAVAIWFDNTTTPVEIESYPERLAAAVGEKWLPRFKAFDEQLLAHHPHDPHHHLALLAVRPHRQSHGLGAELLERHHEWLDDRGVDAYLEASGPRSRDLYLRHGYQPLGDPYYLPNDGPPMFPMWRKPR
ncbi:MAG TPA: N-acetyltransferase [Micromonosporaceae bacterium]|nr:N-acetyltransferase [Micromonosporaceae bacterium]